ncbi:transcriptional regulator with XRE-family HTH domain [Rhizobium sp. SG_E_25_P2]|uniref:helix-turn-helix transcriptional regulator n=1 Tax=Rhizobium sp. SG_E_25_P2 TaxID=2879942 RepID=UPI0024767787|nr:helix-turn-helix transcriptional regulator [Rhizobium sp. SG_E_25_P2]MDH6269902.1 transcriptional regulator with XRE-family HTH domain [Rhizobium sp. SG_E_25_P2]
MDENNALGRFLRDLRARRDPASFGFTSSRRRTPGLRREEVAQRAHISPAWYTWLEQGRGGPPSADVLDRIARGMLLTEPEREHLFILGLGHPPPAHYRAPEGVSPRLQRLIDALEVSPAIVRTATWEVLAWNRAAALVLTDYARLPPDGRNLLRLIFSNPDIRAKQTDWRAMASGVVAAFRADATRAGASAEITRLVEELSALSPDFAEMWADASLLPHGDGAKRLNHPRLGLIELEYSSFAVDGRPDLGLIVYNPVTDETAARIRELVRGMAG